MYIGLLYLRTRKEVRKVKNITGMIGQLSAIDIVQFDQYDTTISMCCDILLTKPVFYNYISTPNNKCYKRKVSLETVQNDNIVNLTV